MDREAIAQKETQKLEDKAAQDARMKRAARGRGGRRARGGPAGGFQDRVIRGGAGGFGSMIEATGSRECFRSCCCTISFTDNNQVEDPADSEDCTTMAELEEAAARVAVAGLAESNQKEARVSAASRADRPAGA